ncbi:ribonuclease D [Marinospirillum perlucidum]|uniref:ribonuclease D n=1 Tax=Marinospirillum perlucidum TaxID=1982602 RepID=UPI000DF1A78C|nr:ribonuclease D [Marinospirillum perlucidum]
MPSNLQEALPHIWVDQDEQLADLCTRWQQLDELAMDTEFIRTDTFYPRPALLQVGDGQACYLLDVLSLKALQPLKNLLSSGPLKIFHSCSEDLEMLYHWLGVLPQPLVDTQVAAAFALKDTGMGYQRLVEELLGLQLEKGETRSDWLQRPLTASQKKYAAQDVEYLLPVWQRLKILLQDSLWLDAVYQEGQWLVDDAGQQLPEEAWLKFKQAWQLDARQLAILQALAEWRELTARDKDRPRSRIASDALLLTLAQRQPGHPAELASLRDASPGWVKRYGQDVLAVIQQAQAVADDDLPEVRVSPITREYKAARKKLRQALAEQAEHLDIPQEILARRKQQDAWLQALLTDLAPQVDPRSPSWRQPYLKAALDQLQVKEA